MDSWLPWAVSEEHVSASLGAREQLRSSFHGPPAPLLPTPPGIAQYVLHNQGQASNSPAGHQTRPIFPPQRELQLPYETDSIPMPHPGNPQPAGDVVPGPARDHMKTRKRRSTAPSDEEWDRHKSIIEDLYMLQNLSLHQTIKTMREQHQFKATDKMYKQKFKAWKWSKYLSKKEAGWMMNRVNQRQPRRTEFQYGSQTWTEERVKRTYDRMVAGETQLNEAAFDGPTPTGITYATPAQHPETPLPPPQPPLRDPLPTVWTPSQPAASEDGFAERLLRSNRQSLPLQDLDKLVVQALRADARGQRAIAQGNLLDAIAGFRKTLSSTDPRTIRASYMLAASYANHQRMDQADEVLNWLTSGIVERWGCRHHRTLAHFLALVELLQSWDRHEHAQVFIYKILDGWDEIEDGRPLDIPSNNTGMVLGSQDDLVSAQAEIFAESSDVGEVDMQLHVAKLWMLANVDGIEEILRRLIAQCEKYPETLAVQTIQARCTFAQRYISPGSHHSRKEARSILKQAWSSLERHMREQDKVAKQLLDLSCRLAFLFFEAGRPAFCDVILEHAASFAERDIVVPPKKSSVDVAMGLYIAIGVEYQERSSWSRARPWFERALALVLRLGGLYVSTAEQLTKCLKEERYKLTPLDSIDGLINPCLIRFSVA